MKSTRAGKQAFLVIKVLPHNTKIKTFIRDFEPIIALGRGPGMTDSGLIMMV